MDTPSYLRLAVTKLSREIGIRSYQDHDKLEQAVRYLSTELSSFGYQIATESFTFADHTYLNVIAELTGTASPGQVLVVGAHYDTVRTTPGADDNASGVAGLLGLAHLFANNPLGKTVRFVAFPLEEPPTYRTKNMGSYHYAAGLKKAREKVEGMVCLEMIGFFSDRPGSQHYPIPFMNLKFPKSGNYIAMVGNLKSKQFTEGMSASFRKATDLPLVTLNAPAFVVGIDFSDHWSFGKFGYPAFMVTDTAFYRNPNYHSPSDLPDTLDYNRMAQVVDGLKAAIEEWGKTDGGTR
jgi:Zn-dependent M28 family amino/carboxypeptidase